MIEKNKKKTSTHFSIRGVCGGDAEVKAHDLPGSAFVNNDVLWTQVSMDHLHTTVKKGQTLRDLMRKKRETEELNKEWP